MTCCFDLPLVFDQQRLEVFSCLSLVCDTTSLPFYIWKISVTVTWEIICFQDERCIHLWTESKSWRRNSLDINYAQKAEEYVIPSCFYWINKQYPQFIIEHVIKQNEYMKFSKLFLKIQDDLLQPQISLFHLVCKLFRCIFSPFFLLHCFFLSCLEGALSANWNLFVF